MIRRLARDHDSRPISRALKLVAADRLMILGPHPDDESLATGGLLQSAVAAGAAVRILYLTDGDNNPWAQLVNEGLWPRSAADRVRWGRRRRTEALAALEELGVGAERVQFLGLPDQGLTDLLLSGGEAAVHTLASELSAWEPTILVLPSSLDCHPDHSAGAVLARLAAERLRSRGEPPMVLHFTVHGGTRNPPGAPRHHVALGPREQERKRRAILRHTSQLKWRRRQLLGFVRDLEYFDTDLEARTRDAHHPVRVALVHQGTLHLKLVPGRRPGLGPWVLRVRLDAPDARRCLTAVALGRDGSVMVSDAVTLRAVGEGACWRLGQGLRMLVPLGTEASWSIGYVKLERPLERRLGLFDQAGWRGIPLPAVRVEKSQERPHEIEVAQEMAALESLASAPEYRAESPVVG